MSRELLHAIFEEAADERPGALALVFGRDQLTYTDLERRANRFARQLRRRGIGRSSVVGMLLPRSTDAYAALLGILKAGAGYVPIEPDCPTERAAFMLDDSHATALVTTAELGAPHARFDGSQLRLDADRDEIEAEAPARLAPSDLDAGPRQLCYVLYASGSSGRPERVMVEHRSACNLVHAEGRIFELRPADRVYQGSSLASGASIEEVWLAFHAGATLVAATPEVASSGPRLSRWLWGRGVSVLWCVPTLLSTLAEDVPTLRLLILGGEPCPASLAECWARPGRRLLDTYCPTEATEVATWVELRLGAAIPIGRALPRDRVHVLGGSGPEGERPGLTRGEVDGASPSASRGRGAATRALADGPEDPRRGWVARAWSSLFSPKAFSIADAHRAPGSVVERGVRRDEHPTT